MYRKAMALVLMMGLCAAVALAQEQEQGKKGPSISEWLKSLQRKVEQIVPKKATPMSTGVAGTRGAKEDSQARLYWKGKKGDEAVTEAELAKFKAGLDLAEKGDRAGSIKALEDFMGRYPDSALVPDAKKTMEMVKAEGK